MLLPSVLPCENAFRVTRPRASSRLQSQASQKTLRDAGGLVGLGLAFAPSTPSSGSSRGPSRLASSCKALQQIVALEKTPKSVTKCPPIAFPPATPSPSGSSSIPTPKTPSNLKDAPCTPWTTPGVVAVPDTPTPASRYTCNVVTRNNKRRRNGESVLSGDPFVTPAAVQTPVQPPPLMATDCNMAGAPHTEMEEDDEFDEGLTSPKRSRIRGPKSRRISSTPRSLGPWTVEEDKQLVDMVFAKLKLTEQDRAEIANTLGRDGLSVGDRWRILVANGDVGLIRSPEKQRREGLSGSGRGRLEPTRRGRTKQLRRSRRR